MREEGIFCQIYLFKGKGKEYLIPLILILLGRKSRWEEGYRPESESLISLVVVYKNVPNNYFHKIYEIRKCTQNVLKEFFITHKREVFQFIK